MVSIFPNLCLWRRSLRSNVGGIDPEKLYRATLMHHDRDTFDFSQGHVTKNQPMAVPV